jgi:hypothetical protein
LKYVRGTLRAGREDGFLAPAELLDRGEELEEGDAGNRFDLDLGLLAVGGPLRVGAEVRNLREPEFGGATGVPACGCRGRCAWGSRSTRSGPQASR